MEVLVPVGYVAIGVGVVALARMDGKSWPIAMLYGLAWPRTLVARWWDTLGPKVPRRRPRR